MTPQEIARLIDHTLLKPETTEVQIDGLCAEALEHRFQAVCVNSRFVPLCAAALRGSAVKVAAVVGFPLGASASAVKAFEAEWSVRAGAQELDMVLPIGAVKTGDWKSVVADIRAVVEGAGAASVKVILETGLLTESEKISSCHCARDAGAAFVKTCTGFGPGAATPSDVALMKRAAGGLQVKASGGIRSLEQALALIEAGATRLGTSSGVALVTTGRGGSGY